MENQGNMQSGKKAAVIYFLAAFFIACIGIAGANYLKGELGLSAEELVKKVELTVEIAVLLGIAIAVRHLLKKRNRKIAGIIVFLFVAGFFSWQNSGIWQESQLKPQRLETPESEFDRYDIKDGHFTVAEANANIVKEINVDYLDNVTVHFSKPVAQKVIVRVLYETKTQHGFDNKTRKMRVKVHKGETVGCVSMKVKDVTRIKIGIGRKIGTQFDYGYTEINGNYAARMHQKKVSMVKYFVFFMLIPAGYFILAAGKKWQEKTDKNICLRILSFPFGFITILSLFATFLVVNLVEWVKMTCGNVSFSIILLQLTSPIKGTDSGIINSIIKTAVVPPVLLAVAAVLCYLFIVRGMYALEDLPVKKIPRWSKICIEVVMVVFFLHTVQVQGTEIGMWDYIQSVRESSDFYEKEYVNPAKVKMTFPKEKKNLIYIFMESMESSYADKEDGGTMDDNYIPNLTKLARENVQFTDKKDGKVGGPVCLEATAYTAGGLVAQTSAINLKVMNSGAVSDSFLPNLTALGDILNKQGYNQMFLCGSDGDFAGRDAYFKTHKDYQIEDYKAAIKEGDIPKDYKVYWGHEDKVLYERAKKNLKKLSKEGKPFNLTMLTVDTHFPNGYICDLCENKYDTTYGNAVACADRQVYDFVQWIKKQDFYEDTTIIIAGDKEGYQQVFLCGSEGDFAGRDTYFTSHKDFHIEDYNAAKKEGFIAPDYKVFWGHEDEILYKRAKKQLEQLSSSDKPFNLTMLTVDTHFPRGYKCRLCKDKYNRQYANVIACADQQVYDFVEWIKKQDFYKNTTIVIAGDHTTMVDTSDPIWGNLNNNYKRTVYNTIINADCTYKENVTENRDFSTMDMFPTTLAALGVQIDGNRLGLGTNLFSGQKTLPEKLGRGYINQELKKNDKEYNGFY